MTTRPAPPTPSETPLMIRLALAAALAAVLAAACSSPSPERCWEDAVNRDVSDGGCQGMSDPLAQDLCLSHWYDVCQTNNDY